MNLHYFTLFLTTSVASTVFGSAIADVPAEWPWNESSEPTNPSSTLAPEATDFTTTAPTLTNSLSPNASSDASSDTTDISGITTPYAVTSRAFTHLSDFTESVSDSSEVNVLETKVPYDGDSSATGSPETKAPDDDDSSVTGSPETKAPYDGDSSVTGSPETKAPDDSSVTESQETENTDARAPHVMLPVGVSQWTGLAGSESIILDNSGPCPPYFRQVEKSCYWVDYYAGSMNWTDAQKFCQKLVEGGKLLELETQEEIYAATKFFQSLDGGCNIYGYLFFYTGGISYNRGPFFWSSSEAPIDKSNWYSGQPDDLSNIRALTLTCPSKFLWTDFDARAHQPFFCEWDPQRSSSSPAETVPNCPCSDSEGKED